MLSHPKNLEESLYSKYCLTSSSFNYCHAFRSRFRGVFSQQEIQDMGAEETMFLYIFLLSSLLAFYKGKSP